MEGVDSLDSTARSNANYPMADFRSFRSRFRSLDIKIVNETGHILRFVGDDFRSGTWYVPLDPVNIRPGETCLGYACSREISFVGVHGGVMYELVGSGVYLYIGFSNTVIGPMKTFIELRNTIESARWVSSKVKTGSADVISFRDFNATALIQPPEQSPFRLMIYTLEEKKWSKIFHIDEESLTDDGYER